MPGLTLETEIKFIKKLVKRLMRKVRKAQKEQNLDKNQIPDEFREELKSLVQKYEELNEIIMAKIEADLENREE